MIRQIVVAMAVLGGTVAHSAAQNTVILVRHAERADSRSGGQMMMAADPELSDRGSARAESLAWTLENAGVTAIYVTEFKRTQQTAAPLAKTLGIQPTTIASRNTAALLDALKAAKGTVLVVGHSNTVPEIIRALGIREPLTMGDDEYDNLLIVYGGEPKLLRLRYR